MSVRSILGGLLPSLTSRRGFDAVPHQTFRGPWRNSVRITDGIVPCAFWRAMLLKAFSEASWRYGGCVAAVHEAVEIDSFSDHSGGQCRLIPYDMLERGESDASVAGQSHQVESASGVVCCFKRRFDLGLWDGGVAAIALLIFTRSY